MDRFMWLIFTLALPMWAFQDWFSACFPSLSQTHSPGRNTMESISSRCTCYILSVGVNMVLANKTCIVPRSPVIFLLTWRFSPERHLTPRGHILPAFVCFRIFIPVLQFVLSTGGRRGIMELLRDNHSHVFYVAWLFRSLPRNGVTAL